METLKKVIKDIKYQNNPPSKPKITKEYIYHLQSEIDDLEEQLFDSNRNEYNPTQSSISENIPEVFRPQEKNIYLSDYCQDSYQNKYRKREDYKELNQYGQSEANKLKEVKYLCKQLENNNIVLQNNMNVLLSEKQDQAIKIKQLQKEIDLLRQRKEERIESQRANLGQHFD